MRGKNIDYFENSHRATYVQQQYAIQLEVSLHQRNSKQMRIGILSDTHDKLDRTRAAIDILRTNGAEVLFHCGDLTGPEILAACAVLPCYFTFGNNDVDGIPDLQQAAANLGAKSLGWGDARGTGWKADLEWCTGI